MDSQLMGSLRVLLLPTLFIFPAAERLFSARWIVRTEHQIFSARTSLDWARASFSSVQTFVRQRFWDFTGLSDTYSDIYSAVSLMRVLVKYKGTAIVFKRRLNPDIIFIAILLRSLSAKTLHKCIEAHNGGDP